MLARLQHALAGTLQRQLAVGMLLVVSLLMAAFVADLTRREQALVSQQQSAQASVLVRSVATAAAVWVASRDYAGVQEIVDGFSGYPDLRYLMVLDERGKVLAHSDTRRRGLYLNDLPRTPELTFLSQATHAVDVAGPVLIAGHHIGWARVGLSDESQTQFLSRIARSGMLYAALAIALSAIIAHLAGHYMTRRLNAIQKVADAVQGGQSGLRVVVTGADEAAQLALRFNAMLDTLSERKLALEQALNRLQSITNRVPGVIVLQFRLHADGRTSLPYASDALRDIYRVELQHLHEDASPLMARVHPDDLGGVRSAMKASAGSLTPWLGEYRLLYEDGASASLLVNAMPQRESDGSVLWQGFITDVTERRRAEDALRGSQQNLHLAIKQLEQSNADLKLANMKLVQSQGQLLQAEKLAAIGQLAAGVAHEVNNPIGFVNSNLGTLKGYVAQLLLIADSGARCTDSASPQDLSVLKAALDQADLPYLRDDIAALLAESLDGLDRVKRIVQDLRDFSRVDSEEWVQADLIAGLESTLNVARNELKYKAEVLRQYSELPSVRCHPGQINQVFLNLLVNAAQAIEGRGTITLSSGIEGPWVWVAVADTGKGMSAELLNRIFEPFFTTKPQGMGTGLGLSLAFDIVARHGGRIDVSSTVGEGSRFEVWLPVAGPG